MDIEEVKKRFIEIYGGNAEDLRVFASPGRVNLIGEHTDYNGGYVLPAALTLRSMVVARARNDRNIRLAATDLDAVVEASLDRLQEYRHLKWGNYQLGVADELQKAGYGLCGCDMLFDDTVPIGSGLSSSAAIEVAAAMAFATLGNEAAGIGRKLDMIGIAKICQSAEHNYVGVKCGIMDQFASAMGRTEHAIFLNCRDLSYEYVPFRYPEYRIVMANTNKKRSLAAVKYNERRAECEKGFSILKADMPDISCLGEVTPAMYEQNKHLISIDVIRKRVEHIVYEDDRVLRSVDALNNGDVKSFGQYMIRSHNSLRYLYDVTGEELDTLVEEALRIDGVLGSRMTGAGFGGCSVSIVHEDAVVEFRKCVGDNYYKRIGIRAEFYISKIGDGGREIFEKE